jgi:hypothetical protein
MAYLGRSLDRGNYLKLDDISSQFNGSSKTFNLTSGGNSFYPGSAFSILVSLGGVVQEPEFAYTININTITFASAPGALDDFFCIALGVALDIGVPSDGTVTGTKLSSPFNYNSGLLYLDSVNNRIGVGTNNPTQSLHVQGNVRITGGLFDSNNNVGAAGSILSSTGSDLSWIAAASGGGISSVSISTNTTNQSQYITYVTGTGTTTGFGVSLTGLVFNPSSNNLGIGTAVPAFKADIAGDARITSTNKMRFGGTAGTTNFYIQYNSTTNSLDFVAG